MGWRPFAEQSLPTSGPGRQRTPEPGLPCRLRPVSQRSWSPTQSGRLGSLPQGRSQCEEFLQARSATPAPTPAQSIRAPAHPDSRRAAPAMASPAHTALIVLANMACSRASSYTTASIAQEPPVCKGANRERVIRPGPRTHAAPRRRAGRCRPGRGGGAAVWQRSSPPPGARAKG